MFKSNQKVTLTIRKLSFSRVVSHVVEGVVYLKEGGQTFSNDTGYSLSTRTGAFMVISPEVA